MNRNTLGIQRSDPFFETAQLERSWWWATLSQVVPSSRSVVGGVKNSQLEDMYWQ